MAKVGKLFVDFEARTATFEEKTKRAGKSMKSFGADAGRAKGQLGLLQTGVGSLVAPLVALASAATLTSSAFGNLLVKEKLDAQLKVATGSAESGKIAFSELSATAKQMPNTLSELTSGFIKLKNYGLDPSEKALLSYGDTAAAMGKSLEQMIEAVADAATGEFERLKEFGIKASTQGDRIRFTFKGVTTEVRKSADEIEQYLINLGETNFGGSMAEQMETVSGKLSNLADSWFQFTNAVAETGGVGGAINAGLGIPAAALDAATLKLREASLDIEQATIADIALLEALIERNEKSAQRLGVMSGSMTALNTGPSLPSQQGSESLNREYKAKLEQLKIEKEIADEKQAALDLEEKRLQGVQALDQWEVKMRREKLGVLKTYREDHAAISNEIYALQQKIQEGQVANVDASIKELEKLTETQQKLEESYEKAKEEQDKARAALEKFTSGWEDAKLGMKMAFAEGIAGGQKLGDVLEDVARILARNAIFNLLLGGKDQATGQRNGGVLGAMFGNAAGQGGWLGNVFGGFFANGGTLGAGKWGIAGERGPEIIHGPATITPMTQTQGAAASVFNINIDAKGAEPNAIDRLVRALPGIIDSRIVPVVVNAQRRGKL